jgi:hypothetical protein
VKVGGSLAEEPELLIKICAKLSFLAAKYQFIVVPGGGMFADVIRDYDKRFNLSSQVSHRMAILGMDQFGMLLAQITPNSIATLSLNDAKQISETEAVPIFLPSRLMLKDNPLENSWDVTSDSIAAYISIRLKTPKLILIKDVDGVFTKEPEYEAAVFIEQLSPEELLKFDKATSVDMFLAKLLSDSPVDCYIVNGKYPNRIEAIFAGKKATYTLITKQTK